MNLSGRKPWDPHYVASLGLGLVAAAIGCVLCDLDQSYQGWKQLVAVGLITATYVFAMRSAFQRSIGLYWLRAIAWFWVMGGAACTVSFGVLGWVASSGEPGGLSPLQMTLVGTCIGLTYGALLIPFALGFRAACTQNLVDVLDRVLFASAVLVAAAAFIATSIQVDHAPHASLGGLVILGAATSMFVVVGIKTWTRARWLGAVIAGKVPGWSVLEPLEGDEALPAIGMRLKRPATLATGSSSGGPFRASAGAIARVARVDAAGGYGQLAIGAFACAALTVAVVPVALHRRAEVIDHSPFHSEPGPPTRFANVGDLTDLAVGANVVCVRLANDTTKCWGSDAGYLLPGDWTSARKPTTSTFAQGQMFLGEHQACTLQGAKKPALCMHAGTPAAIGPAGAEAVAFGHNFKLVRLDDGSVTRALLPNGTDPESAGDEPMLDPPFGKLGPAKYVAASGQLGCALTNGSEVFCFGNTFYSDEPKPAHRIAGLPGDRDVSRLVVRKADAWARSWVSDRTYRWYAWSDGDAKPQPKFDGVEELAVNRDRVCGLRADGSVICAQGHEAPLSSPKEFLPPGSAVQIGGVGETMCARGKTDVWCWGEL